MMKRSPEWWAVYGATWALMRRSGLTETRQSTDRTFVTSEVSPSALAAFCAAEADAAMSAWEEFQAAKEGVVSCP